MGPYDEESADDYSDEDTVDPDQDYDFDSPTDFDEYEMNPDDCGDPLDIEYDR
jgi:hypothetical protein